MLAAYVLCRHSVISTKSKISVGNLGSRPKKDTVFWECARLTGDSVAGESPAGGVQRD